MFLLGSEVEREWASGPKTGIQSQHALSRGERSNGAERQEAPGISGNQIVKNLVIISTFPRYRKKARNGLVASTLNY